MKTRLRKKLTPQELKERDRKIYLEYVRAINADPEERPRISSLYGKYGISSTQYYNIIDKVRAFPDDYDIS